MTGAKRRPGVSPPREGSKRIRVFPLTSQSNDNPSTGEETLAGATEVPASVPDGALMCPCGAGKLLVLPSARFPSKQYYGCPKQDDGGCHYFMWCDAAAQVPASNACSKSSNACSKSDPCPYPVKVFTKDYLFELFLGNNLLSKCTPLSQKIKYESVVTSYMVPGARDAKHRSCSRQSPFAQGVVHSIVLYLSKLQEAGWSLNGNFTFGDFFVTPFGKYVMDEEKLNSLVKASDSTNRLDFRQVDKIIQKDIFKVEIDQLPIDLKIFGEVLREFEENNRCLVVNSAALMTHEKQLQLLSKIYKKLTVLEKTDPDKHKAILAKLPYIDTEIKDGEQMHWKLRAETHNKYLSYHLAYTSEKLTSLEKAKEKMVKSESADGDVTNEEKIGNDHPPGGKGQVKLSLEKAEGKTYESESADVKEAEILGKNYPSGGEGRVKLSLEKAEGKTPESESADVKEAEILGKNYPDGGQGQVKLIRNCDEHLHEAHGVLKVRPGELVVSFNEREANHPTSEYCDNGDKARCIEIFKQEEVGYIIDEAFPGSIVTLQKAMHEAGELNDAL